MAERLRVAVFLLILANLLFYAFAGGYFGEPENPDAGRFARQLASDRLRIVGYGQKPPPARGNGERPSVEAERAEPEEMCLLWNRLAAADADRLASSLAEKFPGVRVERHPTAGGAGVWVMVPSLGSKGEAERKVAELKGLGVSDLLIIQEAGPNQFAISLGVFSNERGGQDRLAELRTKGVRSARLMPRPGKGSQYQVEVRGPLAKQDEVKDFAADIVAKSPAPSCK